MRAQDPSTCAPRSPTLPVDFDTSARFHNTYAMKRRRSASDGHPGPPRQSTSSPWRWNIGGPILDFGDEAVDAGPSTAPCACDDCAARPSSTLRSPPTLLSGRRASRSSRAAFSGTDSDDDDTGLLSSSNSTPVAATSRRRLRKQRDSSSRPRPFLRPLTTALALSLATAPLAAAGPVPLPSRSTTLTAATDTSLPPTRTIHSSPTTAPADTPTTIATKTTDDTLQRRRIESVSLFEEPSLLPSATLATLSAEALPYVVTQSADGRWYHDERPWWIYGVVMVRLAAPADLLTCLGTPRRRRRRERHDHKRAPWRRCRRK